MAQNEQPKSKVAQALFVMATWIAKSLPREDAIKFTEELLTIFKDKSDDQSDPCQ